MDKTVIRAAGYIRVSTDKQAEHGSSLEAQQAMIGKYAAVHGYDLVRNYVDGGFSAKSVDRPAFQELFAEAKAGRVDLIMVSKLDRLTRSARDFYNFIEDYVSSGLVNIVAISEGLNTLNPVSKMLIPLLVSIGQIEREQTASRVRTAIHYIREQGGHYGKVPFGYATVAEGKLKRLVPHPTEHAWLQKMFAWYKEGKQHTEIARLLDDSGIKPRQSEKWSLDSVREILCKHGVHKPRSVQSERVYDKPRAFQVAYQLRSDQRSFPFIARELNKLGLRPKNAASYQASSTQDLLRSASYHDRTTAAGCARYWKEQGLSLRAIGEKLLANGHTPKRGGQWYAQQVRQLLIS